MTVTPLRWMRQFNYLGWAVVLLAVAAWEVFVRAGFTDITYLPAPTAVLDALIELFRSHALLSDVRHTIGVALLASAFALVVGVFMGTLIALSRVARTYSMASIDLFRSLPVLALMPVALLIWGPVGKTELIVATYAALWPILINTLGAVNGVPKQLHDVSATLRLSRREKLTKVVVPAAIPGILVGARLAVVSAFVVAIVAEMVVNPEGIGWGMVSAEQALASDRLFAYAVISGLLGFLVNVALTLSVRLAMPGSRTTSAGGPSA